MPSFTFFSTSDKGQTDTLRSASQCIVPEGYEGIRGKVESEYSNLQWHCGAHTPLELHKSNAHGFAFLIGEAIAEDSDNYLSATELFEMVTKDREQAAVKLSRYSGFFAWIVVLDDESVYCGSDPFGFFPVYTFHGKRSIVIASSLNALHAHPEYDQTIDPVGFCRYLLENGCSSHRTLEKSGKRLNIAESISYHPESLQFRQTQHPLPGQHAIKNVHTITDAVQLSIEASTKAVKRHTQRPADTCLLSGGLDSRHVLSIAHKLGQRPACITNGEHHSYESINARRIARKLKLPWECSPKNSEAAKELFDNEMNMLSLGGGFNSTPMLWSKVKRLQGTRYLTGLFLDVTYGPFDMIHHDGSFGSYHFAQDTWIHNYGVKPNVLADVFNNERYKKSLQGALDEVRTEWETSNTDLIERHWHTIARYRARAHHGGIAWKNAFYSWPIIPALDVPLTEAIRTIDGQLMLGRKLQQDTFIAMEPELAKIPLASISSKPRPLVHSKLSRYYRKMEKLQRRIQRYKGSHSKIKVEDKKTGSPSWEEARSRAVDQLDLVTDIFDISKVKKIIAPSNAADKIDHRDQYSKRLLIGGICWLINRQKEPQGLTSNLPE